MKRDFQKLIAFIAFLFLPFALLAQTVDPVYGIVIDESFEKGIPADWTQENVSGSIAWVGESTNLTYPNGAADSLARIAFRNTSGVTQKAVTRLVLPSVDVAAYFQPVLIFSHAQDKWSGDFDSLRVLCRTSANGTWNVIASYDNYISKWQRDTIYLPAQTYVQIAFEATDNLGRGVVIDDVVIRSTPSCFDPEDLYTSNVTNNSITVNWSGSFDAEYFYVKLSKTPLTDAELANPATELLCDTTTDGVSIDFEGLVQGTKYYCYVMSQCEHEISSWVLLQIKTANIINVPDTITFERPDDVEYVSGTPYFMDGWYYAAAKDDYKPYGNANLTDWKYGASADGSGALVFAYYTAKTPYHSYLGSLPADTWAYAATPEINNMPVKDLQVTFETFIYYEYTADQHGIIVGVMTDPEDRSTFVPVKTIINTRQYTNEEFVVSFENYTGEGKYIAFMSDFGKSNRFCIDNLIIEPRKEIVTPQFDIMMTTASTMQFKFEQQYDSYEVILSASEYSIDRGQDFPDTLEVLSKHTIANMGVISDLTPDARYFVYVRAVKGDKKGRWAFPRYVEMPSRIDAVLPYTIDFDNTTIINSIDMNGWSSSSNSIPKIIKPLYTYPSSAFKVEDSATWAASNYLIAKPLSAKDFAIGCYYYYDPVTIAVFPEVDDVTKLKVSFNAVARIGSASINPETSLNNYKSKAAVGVMTDANDMNTFIPIDTIEPSYLEYGYYEYDLSTYPQAQGRFFAIKVEAFDFVTTSTGYTNKVNFDNVKFARSADCKSPSNMEAEVDPNDPSKATITWAANGVTEWNVRVATTEYDKNLFTENDGLEFAFKGKVTAPKAEITGLIYPYQTYYYWIQPVCDGVGGEWTMVNKFETFCPAVHTVPYIQDFESAEPGSRIWTGFTADCMFAKQWSRNVPNTTPAGRYDNKFYYPYVTNTRGYNSNQSFPIFKKYTSTSRNYVALPELDKPVDSLQISFRIYSLQSGSAYWNMQEIAVGVMSDPMDIKTFEQIVTVKPTKQKTWERVVVKLDEYVGKGKHIAICETDKFTCNPTSSSAYAEGKNSDTLYVDNIEVNVAAPCDIPYDVYASDVTPNAATINWQSDAESFVVVVANQILSGDDLANFDDFKAGALTSFDKESSIISVDTVVGTKKVRVNELTINQDYYVYIKGFCSGMYTDYAVDYTFSTYCPAMPIEDFYADFSDAATGTVPDCWFAGKTSGEYQSTQSIVTYVKVNAANGVNTSAYNQGQCLLLSSTNGAVVSTTGKPTVNGTYVITPSLDIDKITDYKVKFKAWTTTSNMYEGCGSYSYARSVIVGVVTNPYNFETFMPVDTVEVHYDAYPYEVYLDSYKYDLNGDTGKFVAFYSNFGIKNNIYLDDIHFERIDDCPRFNAEVVAKTPSSVTLEFTNAPESYEVKCATINPVLMLKNPASLDNDSIYPPTVATSKNVTLEGLQNHKEYFFYARSTADTICNEWKLVTSGYAADSLAKAIPFKDGFETTLAGSYAQCPHDWYGFYKDDDVSYPSTTTTAKTGVKSAYLYTASSASVYLVSPELLVDKLSDCFFEFNVYSGLINGYPAMQRAVTIGVVSDPNNLVATFTPLDTLLLTPDMLSQWIYYKRELTDAPSNAKHVAILLDYGYNAELFPTYKYASIYVDDVTVDYIPACYEPNSFRSELITDNSISLSFSHEGAPQYEAIYGFNGFEFDSISNPSYAYAYGVDTVSFTGKEFTINSLLSEVSYSVYVRALCTEQDRSNWVYAGSYKTLPALISTFPYINNFEDPTENAYWKKQSTGWYIGVDNDSLVADQKNSTDFALYYSNDGGASTTNNKKSDPTKIYRYVNLTEGTYEFSYDWVVPSTPKLSSSQAIFEQNLVRAFLIPSTVSFPGASSFKTQEGRSITMSYIDPTVNTLPENWFDLSDIYTWGAKTFGALWGTDLSLPLDQQWKRHTSIIDITEENEGTYMIVFLYYGGSKSLTGAAGYRTAAIDNLHIIKSECGSVSNLKVDNKLPNSVSLSWNTSDNSIASYDVLALNADVDPRNATEAQKAYTGTATTTSATITGLNPFTTYYIYVRPTCESQYNLWGNPLVVTTEVAVPDGYTFSFEEEDMLHFPEYTDGFMYTLNGDKNYNNITTMGHKWVNVSLIEANNTSPASYNYNKNYAAYHPQIAYDTLRSSTQYRYGRTGEHALWLGSRSTSASWMNGATAAMPYAGEFDGKRLIFYMRPFGTSQSTTSSAPPLYASTYYPTYYSATAALSSQSRKITVGTMTDPNDATTFVPLDTIQYPYLATDYSSSSDINKKDPSGDKGWYRVVLNLDGVQGKYVAFRYEWYGTATVDKTVNMFIDDVTIETIPACPAPELMKLNKLKETFAEVDYYYIGDEVPTTAVEISTDENFMTDVVKDTFNTVPFTVTGLKAHTKYYMRAQVICSDLDKSNYSATLAFETPKNICYDNNFDKEASHFPAGWVHAFYPTHDNFVKSANTLTSPAVPASGNTWGWKLKPGIFAKGNFSSKHLTCLSSTSSASNSGLWAVSSLIALDDVADQHLSFKLGITQRESVEPFDMSLLALDTLTSFGVFICEGDNYIYTPGNMTLWKNAKNSKYKNVYDFLEIPHKGAEYSIDLSAFKGKNIKVLFCLTTQIPFELHIDDMHINKYVEKEYDASTCEYCDYEDNNFMILSSNTQLGSNRYHKWELQNEDPDTMLILNLNVADVSETELSATICEGDVYNKEGFEGLVNQGVYRRKFTSADRCDSLVTLNLNVVKPQVTTLIDTICFGTSYNFNGTHLNRTGLYADTLVSVVTGCDSIVNLVLTVKDVIRKDQYVNICFGDTYTFGKQTISASGTYEELFKTVDGCDSLVTLHATVLPDYRKTINAVIKKGEEYNANGFKGLTEAGEYTLPLKSVDGCDSTVILVLKVLSDVSNTVSMNLCFGDTYVFGSQTITKGGEYVEVFKAADGGDSTVILTVTALPDLRQTIEATICAGETYNENGFSNLSASGEYTLPLKSVDGCDSTVTLNLTVLSGDTTYVEKSITTAELPYEYQSIRYDKSTKPGKYVDTIVVKTGNCEEVIIHTLIISSSVAVDNATTRDLIMVPNPVAVNGTLYINAEFTSEERNGLIVEVFNAIGQCVYTDVPTVYPIQVTGLAERGMYIVRIITGDGKSYQGKIIVE